MADQREDSANPFAAPEASLDVPPEENGPELDVAPPEPERPIAAEDRVFLGSTGTVIEAETIASALRGQGISVALVDHQTVGATGVIGGAIGGVKIYIAAADADRARALLAKSAGAGKPVFVVKRKPVGMILLGLLGGLVVGVVVGAVANFAPVAIVGMIMGGLLGARGKGAVYCSSPRCGAPLELEAKICPGCGGVVAGIIGHPDERLEAEERLRAGSSDSSDSSAS